MALLKFGKNISINVLYDKKKIKNESINIYSNGVYTPSIGFDGLISAEVVVPADIKNKSGATIEDIMRYSIDTEGKLQPATATSLTLSGFKDIGRNGLFCTFSSRYIHDVHFPDLVTLTGVHALYSTFQKCSDLVSASFPKLQLISGDGCMYGIFRDCSNLKSVDFPNLTEINGGNASSPQTLASSFSSCTKLTSISFPKLSVLSGDLLLSGTFRNCTNLSSVSLPKLTKVKGNSVFSSTFSECQSLTTVHFPSLKEAEASSFSTDTFSGCSKLTEIHFRYDVESLISATTGYSSKWGATNATIYFDLSRATLSLNVTSSSPYKVYVDGQLKDADSFYVDSTEDHIVMVYNENGSVFIDRITNLVDNETRVVNVNLTQQVNSITFNLKNSSGSAITDASPVLNIEGSSIPFLNNGDGTYVVKLANNVPDTFANVPFSISSTNYAPYWGEVSLKETATINITLASGSYRTFTRPNLTTNGTLGGSSFAVYGISSSESNYPAWKAVDSSTSTYFQAPSKTVSEFIIYNPNFLKVTSLTMSHYSTTYCSKETQVYGSQDNATWDLITKETYTSTSSSRTMNLGSETSYKYYKLVMTPYSSSIRIANITFTAQEFILDSSDLYNVHFNITPADASVITSQTMADNTVQVPYGTAVSYRVMKSGYIPYTGNVFVMSEDKEVSVTLSEDPTALTEIQWFAWQDPTVTPMYGWDFEGELNNFSTVYTLSETPQAGAVLYNENREVISTLVVDGVTYNNPVVGSYLEDQDTITITGS